MELSFKFLELKLLENLQARFYQTFVQTGHFKVIILFAQPEEYDNISIQWTYIFNIEIEKSLLLKESYKFFAYFFIIDHVSHLNITSKSIFYASGFLGMSCHIPKKGMPVFAGGSFPRERISYIISWDNWSTCRQGAGELRSRQNGWRCCFPVHFSRFLFPYWYFRIFGWKRNEADSCITLYFYG